MSFQMYPTPPVPEDDRPLLSRDTMAGYIYNNGDAFARWQRRVDAGLIGNREPMTDEMLDRHIKTAEQFRRIRLEMEAAARADEWK